MLTDTDLPNGTKVICFLMMASGPIAIKYCATLHKWRLLSIHWPDSIHTPWWGQGPGARAWGHHGWTRRRGACPHAVEHPRELALTEIAPLSVRYWASYRSTCTSTSESLTWRNVSQNKRLLWLFEFDNLVKYFTQGLEENKCAANVNSQFFSSFQGKNSPLCQYITFSYSKYCH